MSELLHSNRVLVLNRHWQAVSITSPAQAFCQMMTGSARGLEVTGHDDLVPREWEEWMELEIRPHDTWVGTARGRIRVPTVVVLCHFGKVPLLRPKFSARAIRERDGNRCQYTGRLLKPGEGNIDHVLPRSRGGETSWTNCVWACKRVNTLKGDKTPAEARLKLMKRPEIPKAIPMTYALPNPFGIREWSLFLPDDQGTLKGSWASTAE
jgi:5-methylcytosine-specific restriction endonuclease McrA